MLIICKNVHFDLGFSIFHAIHMHYVLLITVNFHSLSSSLAETEAD